MTKLTPEIAAKLTAQGYTWAVVQQYGGQGYERGDLRSKHRTYEAAHRAGRSTFVELVALASV